VKILIAEDDATSRHLLVSMVRKAGHEVLEACDGREAWDRFRWERPRVVITDRMMPGLDGLALCRGIRDVGGETYTYILFLTALKGKTRLLEGLEAGADDYLTKPVDPEELMARLRVAERILGLRERILRLEGLLSICSYCKRIRRDDGEWSEVERYVAHRSDASFTHSICPECFAGHVEPQLSEQEDRPPSL
jgi:phosphoserine phosphatase RsbU/P